MSRKFNGTSQALSVAVDLSGFAQVSLSFWLWWDTFANNDKLAFEYTADYNAASGFIVDANASSNPAAKFDFGMHVTAAFWTDGFTRPSAAAWHHYVLTMNRATPVNVGYLDGALATLTNGLRNAATYANFANSTLNFMSRNHASLWGAGRMAEVGLWGGTILTAGQALALSSGANPMRIGPIPTYYWPLLGETTEPDYAGTRKTLTHTGTPTVANHPPVRSFLRAA